jgi:hypothetical protein
METVTSTGPLLYGTRYGVSITPVYDITYRIFHEYLESTVDRFRMYGRSKCPRGLRRGSAAAYLLGLRVRMPPVTFMSVSCDCCVSSGRGLCVGPITRPEGSYRVSCVLSVIMQPRQWGPCPLEECRAMGKVFINVQFHWWILISMSALRFVLSYAT